MKRVTINTAEDNRLYGDGSIIVETSALRDGAVWLTVNTYELDNPLSAGILMTHDEAVRLVERMQRMLAGA